MGDRERGDLEAVGARKVVIIGAGIVGCALADELTLRGLTDVTVLEQGPLFATGGSSSHAPGLVFQTNPSRTMSRLAQYTVDKYVELGCFDQVGSLEVATTPARLAELHRRHGFARSWGISSGLLGPDECRSLYPLLGDSVLGGLHVPGDGLARAVPAGEAQALRAQSRGAVFRPFEKVVEIVVDGGRVTGVRTASGSYPADVVVSCAGFWGPSVGALAGVRIPLLPMAHQYAHTEAVGSAPSVILRHQDQDLYFRSYPDGHLGVGSYLHPPMPIDVTAIEDSTLGFTPPDFEESWAAARDLLPALRDSSVASGFNGVFSFTADGFPLLGESPVVRGFWSAEAVWVTHSAGVGRAVAEWIVDGRPSLDLHECDLNRFHESQLSPAYVHERSVRAFVEVYDIIHPLDPPSVRDVRVSAFHPRQVELGAVFGEGAGWERPLWYESNATPAGDTYVCSEQRGLERDSWSARHWSPIAATEARVTRERVALYDMTPLMRLEIVGPVSFLQGLTTNNVDKPVGTVVYTLLLDQAGGILSDITVARLAEDRFQVGVNGMLDLHWFRRHAPDGVRIRDITGGTCGLGVWGPLARELVAPLTDIDVSHRAFGYFKARQGHIGTVPVTMLRVSYVGELGWEVYASADQGLKLWDTLWAAGRDLGIIAGGRAAFNSLRLEKGYRLWGTDMTPEDDPYQSGLGFAVRLDAGDFVGLSTLRDKAEPDRKLTCLVLEDEGCVPMGKEPILVSGTTVGFVTSAAYGHTIGSPIAYGWLPVSAATPGTVVQIGYFDRLLSATVAEEPLVDPTMERIRR
ncbi:FAD-dependent oxidoreductase [Actinoplanes sp. NBRC 103695]|uniref:GcvT family protein n=1 Tax=Actinoplanes sp. NBRC 103695 TaxID=3032202 RepID=UPI0024A40B7F|nr:FAD-dependent oxidoreductase [Actinoplanes sp. NBRC 103695]GLY94150.1 sarcosine dehydrogenase [Actinoplanes sp. NBRC 103695]